MQALSTAFRYFKHLFFVIEKVYLFRMKLMKCIMFKWLKFKRKNAEAKAVIVLRPFKICKDKD